MMRLFLAFDIEDFSAPLGRGVLLRVSKLDGVYANTECEQYFVEWHVQTATKNATTLPLLIRAHCIDVDVNRAQIPVCRTCS